MDADVRGRHGAARAVGGPHSLPTVVQPQNQGDMLRAAVERADGMVYRLLAAKCKRVPECQGYEEQLRDGSP